MQLNTLNEKLKYVKEVLEVPYHFFQEFHGDKMFVVHFQNKEGKKYKFVGTTMFNAVEEGEEYAKEEVRHRRREEPNFIKKRKEEEKNKK